jgi:NhaC family Na+:H+ antiporter
VINVNLNRPSSRDRDPEVTEEPLEPPEPSLLLALATLVCSLAVVLIGGVILKVGFLIPLLVAAAVAAIFGRVMGFRWNTMQDGILRLLAQGLIAILILLLVGALIGIWILDGTVPLMLSWGLDLLSPNTFLLGAFLLCALFALATGTSFGAIGSAGLALLGVGQAMGYPLGPTVGAIVGGAFLGDKMSPVSDTANTASAITGVNLFRHISSLLYITLPAAAVAIGIYAVWGTTHSGGATPEQIDAIQSTLDSAFELTPFAMLPPLVLIAAAILRVSPLPTLALSLLTGALIAILVNGASLTSVITVATKGYKSGTGDRFIDGLLTRGGLESMFETVALIICALTLGGVLERTGTLRVLLNALIRLVHHTGTLIAAVLVSCWLLLAGTGNVFVALILPGRAFLPAFADREIHPRVLSRTLEDGSTITSPLIPWSLAAFFVVNVLHVPATTYAPYTFFNLLCPLLSIIAGITGYAIFRQPRTEISTSDTPG